MRGRWARSAAQKPKQHKQIQQGAFKASARRARRATATGTVSPLAGFCEFLRESKNKTGFNDFGIPQFDLDRHRRDARRSARRRFVSLALPPPLATRFRAFPRPQIPHLRCPQPQL